MTDRTTVAGLQVATSLHKFLQEEALPAAGIDPAGFWAGVAAIIADLTPANRALLARRDELQAAIDSWHQARDSAAYDLREYKDFLTRIGYLVPDPGPFSIGTANVDEEIASLAGPQLVVPVSNARFALNAANARWGSHCMTPCTGPMPYPKTTGPPGTGRTTRCAATRSSAPPATSSTRSRPSPEPRTTT